MTSSEHPKHRSGPASPGSGPASPPPPPVEAEPSRSHPWLVAGLCLAAGLAPFAWSTRFVAEYTLPKLFILQLGVLAAAAGAAARAGAAWRTPLDLPVAVNLVALLVTTLASQDTLLSLEGRYNSYSHGLWASGLYAALCLGAARLDRRSARTAAGVLLGLGSLIAAYGVAQIYGYEPFLRAPLPLGRAVSSIGSPVDLGAYLAALLPLAAAWTLGRSRLLGAPAAMLIAAGLWATASRGSWLGAAAGLVVLAALGSGVTEPGRAKDLARRAPAWAWVALVLAVAASGWILARRVAARGVSRGTDSARVEVWRSAWRIFEAHPWLGTGPDTFEQAFRRMRSEEFVRRMEGSVRFQAYAHNDLLQALATTGILGAGAYLYLLYATLAAGLAACRGGAQRWLAAGLLSALVAVFVNVKFNPIALEVMAVVSLLSGLLAALSRPGEEPACGPLAGRLERGAAGALAAASFAGLCLLARWGMADLDSKSAQVLFAKTGNIERLDPVNAIVPGLRIAGMEAARQAIELRPCELAYRVQAMNEMGSAINATKNAGGRLTLLAEAMQSGQDAVKCHPNEVNAHYVYGVAAWMHVQLGLEQHLELAERELDEAIRRDPFFLPLLEQRFAVARRRGGPSVEEWARRIQAAKQRAPS